MKKKGLVLIILAALALVLVLAACNRGDDPPAQDPAPPAATTPAPAPATPETPETPAEREMITVSIAQWNIEAAFAGEPCAMYLYIQERFGLTFVPYHLTWDNFLEVPYLWAAAGTLPDIIGASDRITRPSFREWIDAGLIRSIPDDLSRWPYVDNWVSQPFAQQLAVNGSIYHIPRGTTLVPGNTSMGRGIFNRRDWREQLGIPVPETEEDFIAMWQAFTDGDMHGDGTRVFGVYPHNIGHMYYQTFIGHGNTGRHWVYIDGSMRIPAFEPSSLQLMSFWRRAFNYGLVNPDFLTDPDSTSITQFALGRAGTLLRLVTPNHVFRVFQEWEALQPDIDFFDAVELLTPPRIEGKDWVVSGGPGHWSETLINSRVDDYTLERILDWFDWQMSPEGINFHNFGFYGQDFTIDANGEIIILTDINPDTGRHFTVPDLYAYGTGGMRNVATWSGDAAEWFNPTIPVEIRQMSMDFRDSAILRPYTRLSSAGIQVSALIIPEVVEMGLPIPGDEWLSFIMDTSATSDEDLWAQFRARWEAAGLLRAQEIVTAEVLARGYPKVPPLLIQP